MCFTSEQIELLKSPLNTAYVGKRKQGKKKENNQWVDNYVDYIEGWHSIAEANRIFGFDGWSREVMSERCVVEKERKIGEGPYQKDGWQVSYVMRVRVTVLGVVKEGTGAGHGIDVDPGQAHESAIKEAETDAMKRALSMFGNQFGLALYDKSRANVTNEPLSDGKIDAGVVKLTPENRAKIEAAFNKADTIERADGGLSFYKEKLTKQFHGELTEIYDVAIKRIKALEGIPVNA